MKDGPARHVIEGVAQSFENYWEAIACLQKRYNCPRLFCQPHVRTVIEALPLKDWSAKELCHLHDVITAMADNSLEAFVTSVIESKLDQASMFSWQDYSHQSRGVPPYESLLEFLDWHARATENTLRETEQELSRAAPERRIP